MKLEELSENPLIQFKKMWEQVSAQEFENGQMMVLSTVGPDQVPSSRIVLFKNISETTMRFYTNYESRKAQELDVNSRASILVYWTSIDVQFRFDGNVEKSSAIISDEYFATRPRESQIGAWASSQSQKMNESSSLSERVFEFDRKFEDQTVPRPTHWGGYEFTPQTAQILHRQPGRLHESFSYQRNTNGEWEVSFLYP